MNWNQLRCPVSELCLDLVLACGQSFRWQDAVDADGRRVWTGVVGDYVVSLKRLDDDVVLWAVNYPANHDTGEVLVVLRDYLALDVPLVDLYATWSRADEKFKKIAASFPGIRMLRQYPLETLFSFICSSNNHISRISGMVRRLCQLFGHHLTTVHGTEFYSFPSLESLSADGVEAKLRECGFGYRAAFVSESAKVLHRERSVGFVDNLRKVSYEEARDELMKLKGVGRKVADCVCLMALDKHDIVPVDTHVFQVAARDYLPKFAAGKKSLTPTVMAEIGDFFRQLYGLYAGWAQSVLFSGELRKFETRRSAQPGNSASQPESARTVKTKHEARGKRKAVVLEEPSLPTEPRKKRKRRK